MARVNGGRNREEWENLEDLHFCDRDHRVEGLDKLVRFWTTTRPLLPGYPFRYVDEIGIPLKLIEITARFSLKIIRGSSGQVSRHCKVI